MQVVGPVLGAHLGPQPVDDVLAVQPMPRRERQQLDQALGLAQRPFPLGDGPGAHRHAELAEEMNRQSLGRHCLLSPSCTDEGGPRGRRADMPERAGARGPFAGCVHGGALICK
jgi:hypothetical protein